MIAPVEAAANAPLRIPVKSAAKPTTAIADAASQGSFEQSVPSVTSTAPAPASSRYARSRVRHGPPKSVNTSSTIVPKTAKIVIWASPSACATANAAVTTIAARTALLSANSPGSRLTGRS